MPPSFIYFDICKALSEFNEAPTMSRLARFSGRSRTDVRYQLCESSWNESGTFFDNADLGRFTDEQFAEEVRKRLGILAPPTGPGARDILSAFENCFFVSRDTLELLDYLALGDEKNEVKPIMLGIISNLSPYLWRHLQDFCPIFREESGIFAVRIISCEAGTMKPFPPIYRIAYGRAQHAYRKKYGELLRPSEIAFCDDRPENIAAAKAEGIAGFVIPVPGARGIAPGLEKLHVRLPPPGHALRYTETIKGRIAKEAEGATGKV